MLDKIAFSEAVERKRPTADSYLDAVVQAAADFDIEEEETSKFLSPALKDKLFHEAQHLNLIKKEHRKSELPDI